MAFVEAVGTVRNRVGNWWHGYEDAAPSMDPSAAMDGADAENDEGEIPDPSGLAEWVPHRLAALQLLFGAGEDGPDASRRCQELIRPLGLNAQMSVVEIGCRLGTGLRTVAGGTGAWIDGIEAEECFIEPTKRLVAQDGLQAKAVPMNASLDDARIQKLQRDVIISRESLHRYPDRVQLLQDAHDLLKPEGQLLFTDYAVDPMMVEDDLEAWLDLQGTPPVLAQLEELRSEVLGAGFDVHVARDESEQYCAAIIDGLRHFSAEVADRQLPGNMNKWILTEVDYWARTLHALRSGALQLVRFHAVKKFADPFA